MYTHRDRGRDTAAFLVLVVQYALKTVCLAEGNDHQFILSMLTHLVFFGGEKVHLWASSMLGVQEVRVKSRTIGQTYQWVELGSFVSWRLL